MPETKKMIRLRCTIVFEYDADPEHYNGASTPEEMAKIDAQNDPFDMLGVAEKPEMKVEPVK